MSAENLLAIYGYAALYIGAIVEGESFLLAGTVLAGQGVLNFPGAMAAAFFGAITGDQFLFYLGRSGGRWCFLRRTRWQQQIDRTVSFVGKFQGLIVPGFRFCYGLRAAIPFVLGMGGYRPIRFLLLNLVGAALWTVSISAAGIGLAAVVDRTSPAHLAVGACGLVGAAAAAVVFSRRRRPDRPPERDGRSAGPGAGRQRRPSPLPTRQTDLPASGPGRGRFGPDPGRCGAKASGRRPP